MLAGNVLTAGGGGRGEGGTLDADVQTMPILRIISCANKNASYADQRFIDSSGDIFSSYLKFGD